MELGSFLSLSGSPGRGGGLAGVPHHPKCLATSIPVKVSHKEHFGIDLKSFCSRADLGHFLGPSHRPNDHTHQQVTGRLSFPCMTSDVCIVRYNKRKFFRFPATLTPTRSCSIGTCVNLMDHKGLYFLAN